MGWYFRKSKSFGPARLNLSKSGVGLSTGIKGARISFGPRGTYINLGRNGIYYRKKIDRNKETRKRRNGFGGLDRSSARPKSEYTQTESCSEDAIRLSGNSNSVFGQNIVKNINRSRLFFWLWFLTSFYLVILKNWGLLVMIVSGVLLRRFFFLRLNFELDDEAELEWKKFTEIINEMRDSKKLWIVESASYNANAKIHAGAYRNLSRGNAKARLIKANRSTGLRVKADIDTAIIKSKKCKILFIPNGILVKKGWKYVAYSFEQVDLYASTTDYIEYGAIAKDAEIVSRTWQYVNKDGSADKRYKNNRQFPVCLYGTLEFSGDGFNVELLASNINVTKNVGSTYKHYKNYFARIEQSDTDEKIMRNGTNHSNDESEKQRISYEEKIFLEEANQTLRTLGENGLLKSLEEQLKCKIVFLDGQLYHQHALFLYKANKIVDDSLSPIEEVFNEKIKYKTIIEPVSENEFLVHMYLLRPDRFMKELPLSEKLAHAIEMASAWKQKHQNNKVNQDLSYHHADINDVVSSCVDLFSGGSETFIENNQTTEEFDGEENTDDSKSGSASDNLNAVNDLLYYFDEKQK